MRSSTHGALVPQAEGRIKERRENEDVNRRELVLKLNEQRRLVVESIRELGATVGSGGQNLLGDPQRLARGVAAFGGAMQCKDAQGQGKDSPTSFVTVGAHAGPPAVAA